MAEARVFPSPARRSTTHCGRRSSAQEDVVGHPRRIACTDGLRGARCDRTPSAGATTHHTRTDHPGSHPDPLPFPARDHLWRHADRGRRHVGRSTDHADAWYARRRHAPNCGHDAAGAIRADGDRRYPFADALHGDPDDAAGQHRDADAHSVVDANSLIVRQSIIRPDPGSRSPYTSRARPCCRRRHHWATRFQSR